MASDDSLLARMKDRAATVKKDIVALWLAGRDPRTPFVAKAVAGLVAAYALSPIDLIPDFIPVIGYLDDLVIVPLGIMLAARLVPPDLMAEFRSEAQRGEHRPTGNAGAFAIVALWIAGAALLLWLFWPTEANPYEQLSQRRVRCH